MSFLWGFRMTLENILLKKALSRGLHNVVVRLRIYYNLAVILMLEVLRYWGCSIALL